MRKATSVAVALGVLFASSLVQTGANAAQPPRVAAESCGALAATIGPANVVQAVFWGQRPDPFERIEETYVSVCFRSKSQCNAWLYWAQTDWQQSHVLTRCRVGHLKKEAGER